MEPLPTTEILSKKVKVTVINREGNEIGEFSMRGGANLWVFLRKNGYPIGSACSGVGVCSACHVKVTPDSPNIISPQNDFEKNTLQRNSKPLDERLACLCRVYHDIRVQSDLW